MNGFDLHQQYFRVGYGPGLAELMFRFFARLSNPLTIEYLPVYTPNDAEKADPALYAHNVRTVMAEVDFDALFMSSYTFFV
jgi:hypothetical protein